jgi:hypothetical protein
MTSAEFPLVDRVDRAQKARRRVVELLQKLFGGIEALEHHARYPSAILIRNYLAPTPKTP